MSARKRLTAGGSWTGVAFIVEAMLLLVFLVASLALFSNLFASAVQRSDESRELTAAVAAASDVAERFAADPSSVEKTTQRGDLTVVCDASVDKRAAGSYHRAFIKVVNTMGDTVYTIDTGCYVSEVSR